MSDLFSRQILKMVVAELSQGIGFDTAHGSTLDILVDALERFLVKAGKLSHQYSEQCQHTHVHPNDVIQSFGHMHFSTTELVEYLQQMEEIKLSKIISKFPLPKSSNFQFPSSVHENRDIEPHLPSMKFSTNTDAETDGKAVMTGTLLSNSNNRSPGKSVIIGKQDESDDGGSIYDDSDDRYLTKPEDIPIIHGTAASSFSLVAPVSSSSDIGKYSDFGADGETVKNKGEDPLWVEQYARKLESKDKTNIVKASKFAEKKAPDSELPLKPSSSWDSSFSRQKLEKKDFAPPKYSRSDVKSASSRTGNHTKSITSRIEEVDRLLHDPIVENIQKKDSSKQSSEVKPPQIVSTSHISKKSTVEPCSRNPPKSVDEVIDAVVNRASKEAEEAELMKFSHLIEESSSSDDDLVQNSEQVPRHSMRSPYDNYSPIRPPSTPSPALSTNSLLLDEEEFPLTKNKIPPVSNDFDMDELDDSDLTDDMDTFVMSPSPPPIEPTVIHHEVIAEEKKKSSKKTKHKSESKKRKLDRDLSIESTKSVEKLVLKKSKIGDGKLHISSKPHKESNAPRLPVPKLSAAVEIPAVTKKKDKKEKKKKKEKDRESKKKSRHDELLPIPKITVKMNTSQPQLTPVEVKSKKSVDVVPAKKVPEPKKFSEPKKLPEPKKVAEPKKLVEVKKIAEPKRVIETKKVVEPRKLVEPKEPKHFTELKQSKSIEPRRSTKSSKSTAVAPQRHTPTESKPVPKKSEDNAIPAASKSKVTTQTIHVAPTAGIVYDESGNKIWICPGCGKPDDGSPMIGCDDCDAWYHWPCVGINQEPPENEEWYCPNCVKDRSKKKYSKRKGKK